MIQSLKGARRQFLVSAPAHAHNFQRKFGQRFPCPNEDGERNDTSEPRDEEKKKPESIRTTGFQCFLPKISHKTLALRDVHRDDELMQRLGAARQTVEEGLERCVRGDNPVVVRARAVDTVTSWPTKRACEPETGQGAYQARKMEGAPFETRARQQTTNGTT